LREARSITVIGSGIGGMASAALLAKTGCRVHVLEQNPSFIGGHGRCSSIGGLRFSMGPQYVWQFGKDQLGDRFIRFLGIQAANPFIPMKSRGFERLLIGDRAKKGAEGQTDGLYAFDVPMGLDRFGQKLAAAFPESADRLNPLFFDMRTIFNAYQEHFGLHSEKAARLSQAAGFLLDRDVPPRLKLRFGKTIVQPLAAFFDQYGLDGLCRRIIYGHGGIFAESEAEMSAIAYIIGTGNYHQGAWYPKNGFAPFFDSLKKGIEQAGGAVHTAKRVTRLETAAGRISRAVCADGSVFAGDVFISDLSPRLTARLLGDSRTARRMNYAPSHSIITCCIGVAGGLAAISEMRGRNCWWQSGAPVNYHDPDVTARPQMLFIGSSTANGFGNAAGGTDDALVVFCPGHYRQEKAIHEAGPNAEARFKRRLAAQIVDILERNVFSGIAGRLRFAEVLSSVDIESETLGERGNAYGRRLSAVELRKGPIRPDQCPPNLHNVSATANSPGIAGGIASAMRVFAALTDEEI